MSSIRLLHLKRLRRQPFRAVLAVVALAAGTALPVAVMIEQSSVAAGAARVARQVAGTAPLRVIGPSPTNGIVPAVVEEIAATPGVAGAAPIVQTISEVERRDGIAGHERVSAQDIVVVLGIDCRVQAVLGPVCGPAGVMPGGDDAPLVSRSLLDAVGRGGVLRTDTGALPLDRALPLDMLDGVNHGHVVVMPLAAAQSRFGRGDRVDVVYVRPAAGVGLDELRSRLAVAAGPQNAVLRATDPAPGLALNGLFVALFAAIAVFALGVGGLLVSNIVALSLAERRRDLAVVAAIGAPARLVVYGTLVEAALVGLVGGLLGCVGGIALAHPLVGAASALAQKFGGLHLTVSVPARSWAEGVAVGVIVAAVAALVPARRAARLDVAGELSSANLAAERRAGSGLRRVAIASGIGLAGLGAAIASSSRGGLSPWQPAAGTVGLLLAMGGLFVAAGAATPVLVAALRARLGSSRAVPALAAANVARDPARAAAVGVAIAVAVGLADVLGSLVPAIHDTSVHLVSELEGSRIGVSTLPFSNSAAIDAKVTPGTQDALAAVPGVASVDRDVFIPLGHSNSDFLAMTAQQRPTLPFPVLRGDSAAAVMARGEVLVGTNLARSRHLKPGSILTVPAPDGMVELRVGAVWADLNNTGRAVTAPYDLVQRYWGPVPPAELAVRPAAGVSGAELAARIRAAGLDPDLRVETTRQLVAEAARDADSMLTPFWALQRGMVLVAFLSTLSTLLLAGIQRRRELGMLQAIGMTPAELWRMGLAEAGLMAVAASMVGGFAGLGVFEALRREATIFVGVLPPFRQNLAAVAFAGLLAIAVCVAASVPTGWRNRRLPVVEALRYE